MSYINEQQGRSRSWYTGHSMNKLTKPIFLAAVLMSTGLAAHAQTQPKPPAQQANPGPQTPAQRGFGDINPKLAQLTDDVLFGDVWARPGLSPRDRSLITVSALIAMNRPDQLRSHLQRARDNGLRESELIEAITHLAFYAGWPSAVTASTVAREVFQKK